VFSAAVLYPIFINTSLQRGAEPGLPPPTALAVYSFTNKKPLKRLGFLARS